jgi:ParB/RepB/Spo0J family partition protein
MNHVSIALPDIIRSKSNPRKTFDAAKLTELAASIKEHGVLQPILVRPNGKAGTYELVAGERRYRAAQEAGLAEIPALVRELTDTQVLEIQVIENLQRDDLHPLEEADGYRQLAKTKGYDVARIAERIGRSVKYVYDRMKLAGLVDEARKIFLDGRITAGHAILLARLKPEDQKRCIGEKEEYGALHTGGLFTSEELLWDPEEDAVRNRKEQDDLDKKRGPYHGFKAVSVRELQDWIDKNVKLEAADVDQMVLPETAQTLKAAAADGEGAVEDMKVLRLTHDSVTPEGAKDGPRVILGRSWERADGQHGSKACEHSQLGMIVIGPHRGEAFHACVAKKKCATHWPDHVKAAKAAERGDAGGKGKASTKKTSESEKWAAAEKKRKEEYARQEAERGRFVKALPALHSALAEKIGAREVKPTGQLADILVNLAEDSRFGSKHAEKILPRGKTLEDLVRHVVFMAVAGSLSPWNPEGLVKRLKPFGVDAQKIVDQVAPAPKPEKPAAAKKPARKGKK